MTGGDNKARLGVFAKKSFLETSPPFYTKMDDGDFTRKGKVKQ